VNIIFLQFLQATTPEYAKAQVIDGSAKKENFACI